MRPATQLQILQPCAQSWAAMTPTGPGRHCAACQKVVVDFTQKTDAEILAYLARAGAAPCGRFRAGQLGRPLQPAATPRAWRSWLASVLALGGVLGSGRAAAQAGNYFSGGPAPVVANPSQAGKPTLTLPARTEPLAASSLSGAGEPLVVQGVVADSTTGDRIPGVTVLLQGTTRGTSTDVNGEFKLELTAEEAAGTLLISSVGYATQRAPAAEAGSTPLHIKLAASVLGEMGIVVAGGYAARRPWPWHPRALYQWSKYQLLRPFRRW